MSGIYCLFNFILFSTLVKNPGVIKSTSYLTLTPSEIQKYSSRNTEQLSLGKGPTSCQEIYFLKRLIIE